MQLCIWFLFHFKFTSKNLLCRNLSIEIHLRIWWPFGDQINQHQMELSDFSPFKLRFLVTWHHLLVLLWLTNCFTCGQMSVILLTKSCLSWSYADRIRAFAGEFVLANFLQDRFLQIKFYRLIFAADFYADEHFDSKFKVKKAYIKM